MEPKDKMHSESQEEIKNSENQSENTNVDAPKEAVAEKKTADETTSSVPETDEEVVNNQPEETVSEVVENNDEELAKDEPEKEPEADQAEVSENDTSKIEVSETETPETEANGTITSEAETTETEANETITSEAETTETDTSEAEAETPVVEEKEQEPEEKTEPKEQDSVVASDKQTREIDYSQFTEVELINELRKMLEQDDFMKIHHTVDLIKSNFYKKHKANLQAQKKLFLDNGGFEEEFKPESDPYEKDLKELMSVYRQKKAQHNKQLEAEKDDNLKKKYEIIEEIKNLVNREESINKTFQDFKILQQKWHEIGLVPQAAMKDMWENYHHHVENFYDYIKINKELRDLDLKKNLEEKIILCERAEALLLEPSVLKAFNVLQKLHDSWREIGPVPSDKREELWERFKDATTKINKNHQNYFENRKKEQKNNLEAKTALCEKVEEILVSGIENHKQWEAKSKDIIELQKLWRTIGFAPKKNNNEIYQRFRNACDAFFDKKREFYAKHKEIQTNNLQLKIDLCVQAESMKDSDDWKKTTYEYIEIQKKWKEIGPVPRKHSDAVWKRFRTACDYFFNRKSNFFSTIDETQVENLKLKNQLIEDVKAFKATKDESADFEKLRDFQRRWTEIGHVPISDKNDVQKRFREAVNEQFDKLKVDDQEKNLLRFKSRVTDWKNNDRAQNKVYAERDKHVVKLKHLESDLLTLKNNVGFFANSKNAESLIKDVQRKITNAEEQIEYLKEKIRIIDQVDDTEE
ncbi:MAG: DUF349 domain-containing protein [Prolixibacteraceae bacterium]|jgi:hypothetical protein|nr:DUF349 domain-containing protein [Prolixibacteraceae bacterium]